MSYSREYLSNWIIIIIHTLSFIVIQNCLDDVVFTLLVSNSAGRGTRTLESRRTSASTSYPAPAHIWSRGWPLLGSHFFDLPSLGTPALLNSNFDCNLCLYVRIILVLVDIAIFSTALKKLHRGLDSYLAISPDWNLVACNDNTWSRAESGYNLIAAL